MDANRLTAHHAGDTAAGAEGAEQPVAAYRRKRPTFGIRGRRMEAAAVEAISLLRPFIRRQFGADVPDPARRLQDLRKVAPGPLPDDYAATLLELRRTTGLLSPIIEAIEPAKPPVPGTFEWAGDNPAINLLYGLQEDRDNVIDEYLSMEFRMPTGLMPIGCDHGNGLICLDLSEHGHGQVLHWFGLGDPGPDVRGRPGRGNTFLLAHSFTDLCRRLRPPPEDDDGFDPSDAKICSIQR